MSGYEGILKLFSKLPFKIIPYPIPEVNKPINSVNISLMRSKKGSEYAMLDLINYLRKTQTNFDFFMLGLHENNNFNGILGNIKHIKYSGIFYTVEWREGKFHPENEIGLESVLL